MLLYYITDRKQFAETEVLRCRELLRKIGEAARLGVDFIQLREKDLPAQELEKLAHEAVETIAASSSNTRLLINSRTDVALAVGADGVHLRSADISAEDVHQVWSTAGAKQKPVIGLSCHTEHEVARAVQGGAEFAVFGPVFEKRNTFGEPAGIDQLRSACGYRIPVFALGGVTPENAPMCVRAGAAGIAGIRLFQERDMGQSVAALRALSPSGIAQDP